MTGGPLRERRRAGPSAHAVVQDEIHRGHLVHRGVRERADLHAVEVKCDARILDPVHAESVIRAAEIARAPGVDRARPGGGTAARIRVVKSGVVVRVQVAVHPAVRGQRVLHDVGLRWPPAVQPPKRRPRAGRRRQKDARLEVAAVDLVVRVARRDRARSERLAALREPLGAQRERAVAGEQDVIGRHVRLVIVRPAPRVGVDPALHRVERRAAELIRENEIPARASGGGRRGHERRAAERGGRGCGEKEDFHPVVKKSRGHWSNCQKVVSVSGRDAPAPCKERGRPDPQTSGNCFWQML